MILLKSREGIHGLDGTGSIFVMGNVFTYHKQHATLFPITASVKSVHI